MRGACKFRQSEVTRLILAAKKAGVEIKRITADKTGGIVIDAGKPQEGEIEPTDGNVWDTIK
jgi:hypothetical protein